MSIADDVVRDFGQTMGMPGLAFNQNGVVRLKFERNGALSIERTARGALLQLARPADRLSYGALERALGLCHFEAVDRLRPDAGLSRDGSLVFSVRLDERSLDVPALEQAFSFLCRLHDRAAG
jgi:type III secretion system chaperone SycN